MNAQSQLGFGLGLRTEHYNTILDTKPNVDWFEIITENYLVGGGKPLYYLDRISEQYPLVMHGVSMSIGGSDPLDFEYLQQIKSLAKRINPRWISDHLCWTGTSGYNMHDLLPLPYTEETIAHVVKRVKQVQDFLGQQLLLENVSSYITFETSYMTEWEFIREVCNRSDCLILLDINNVYVSSVNHGFDAKEYIRSLPSERIQQFHLAGHSDCGDYIIDTHDHKIVAPVWNLYRYALQTMGMRSTMIERDDDIPPFAELLAELNDARQISRSVLDKQKEASI